MGRRIRCGPSGAKDPRLVRGRPDGPPEYWTGHQLESGSSAARERLERVAELPRALRDPRAAVTARRADAAAVVPLQRPEGELGDAGRPRPVLDHRRVGGGEDLRRAEVVDAEHLGDAEHVPEI